MEMLWVDDILLFLPTDSKSLKYRMKDLGEAKRFIGIGF